MPGLTETQTTFLRGIFRAAPDSAVTSLRKALSAEANSGTPMSKVFELVAEEAADRAVRDAVFGPLTALCRQGASPAMRFPTNTIPRLWTALRSAYPQEIVKAEAASLRDRSENAPIYDQLCGLAADGLRAGDAPFQPAIGVLAARGPKLAEEFAHYLDLSALAREALAKLPEWIGRLTEERAAAARIAYKDACAYSEDAGPRYFEILYANLSEPWMILRVLSAVMDRPSDSYVAVSELACFGEYILEDIDRRLDTFAAFDPDQGRMAGISAGEALHIAAQEIAEFETDIDLNKEGPWGRRLVKQRQTMASLAEARYGQIEKALDLAMPLQLQRFGKGVKAHPKLTDDPDPRLLQRAEGLMGFFDHSRLYASQFGFGAARAKVAEMIDVRMDHYVGDLLELLRGAEPEHLDRVRAFLGVAADIMEVAQGAKAAQLIRRRAQAA
jgi:hypothetical protein